MQTRTADAGAMFILNEERDYTDRGGYQHWIAQKPRQNRQNASNLEDVLPKTTNTCNNGTTEHGRTHATRQALLRSQ